MDETSLTLGWLVGKQIAGMRRAKKEPIAYLYNGEVRPPLPEAVKDYPFAAIGICALQGRCLFISKVPILYQTVDNYMWGGSFDRLIFEGDYKKYYCYDVTADELLTEWALSSKQDDTYIMEKNTANEPGFMWANHDVLEGGIVRIAASDPIPVYA